MSIVLSNEADIDKKLDAIAPDLTDLEAPSEVPACTVQIKRESICTFMMYVLALTGLGCCLRQFSDGDFSSVLTVGAAVQAFGFTILLHKVQIHQSVAGLSARSLELFATFYSFRLFATTQKDGYIPVDKSGDWLYQVFDCCALLMVLQLLYAVHVSHRKTYQSHLDWGLDFARVVPAFFIVAFFCHGELNHNVTFDVIWQISLNIETLALVPQLAMMYKVPKVEALNAHYVACMTLGKFCAFLFWFWGFSELAPREGGYNLAGYMCVSCHAAMVLASAEFMIKYLRVVLTQAQEAVKVLDEK